MVYTGTMSRNIAYLGVLAAPTTQGKRAVAVSLCGAVELHHLVYAGFSVTSRAVEDWLWSAGINPEDAAIALPPEIVISDIIVPELGRTTLVVSHDDLDVPFVDALVRTLGRQGSPAIVSGISLSGPIAAAVNGAAGRRAYALQAAYEAALEQAATEPAEHRLSGQVDRDGRLTAMAVDGPFAKGSWTIAEEDDALFVAMSLAPLAGFATLVVEEGPAAAALSRLAAQVGLEQKLAA